MQTTTSTRNDIEDAAPMGQRRISMPDVKKVGILPGL